LQVIRLPLIRQGWPLIGRGGILTSVCYFYVMKFTHLPTDVNRLTLN